MEHKKEHIHIKRSPSKKQNQRKYKSGRGYDLKSIEPEFIDSDYVERINYIKKSSTFTLKGKNTSIFSIEIFEKIPPSYVKKILKYFNAELLTYLSSNRFLVKCDESSIDKIEIEAKKKKISETYKHVIKSINVMYEEEKMSKDIKKVISNPSQLSGKVRIFGLLMPKFDNEENKELISRLNENFPDSLIKKESFLDNTLLTFSGNVHVDNIKKIASHGFVYRISEEPKLIIDSSNIQDAKEINIKTTNEKLPTLCVIDSGIDTNVFGDLILDCQKEPYILSLEDEEGHGTNVSSVAIFGEELTRGIEELNPQCRLYGYKIDTNNGGMFPSAVMNAILKYKSLTKVFNISTNYYTYNESIADINNTLDNFVKKNNIILVNSCGNIYLEEIQTEYANGKKYPEYIKNYPCCAPSIGKNIVAVGSYATADSENSIANKGQISPYSRMDNTSDIKDSRIKPDIVCFGGNVEINNGRVQRNPDIEMHLISKEKKIIKHIGTSFSAPYISNIFATLNFIYSDISNVETLKALLLCKCKIDNFNNKEIYKLNATKEDICYSDRDIVYYSEGLLRPKYYDEKRRSHIIDTDRIKFYVPKDTELIRIVIVHSNDFEDTNHCELESQLDIKIFKPGRNTELNQKDGVTKKWFDIHSPVNYAEFHCLKGQRGFWDIILSSDSKIGNEYTVRYGVAINLIFPQKIISDYSKEYNEIMEELESLNSI